MADELEIASKAIKQIQDLRAELVKLSQDVQTVNKNTINISTPSGLSKSNNDNAKASAEIEALKAKYSALQQQIQNTVIANQKLASQNNTTAKSTSNVNTATRANAVANQIARAETDRNIRATTLLGGAYARASAQLLILKKEAKDLAIIYGENSVQAKKAANAALELDGRIKAVDKSVGDSQRNVGNYGNAFTKGLGGAWSIVRQLAYILPGLGVAGILGFAIDPLVNYVKNLEFVQKALGNVKTAQGELNSVNLEAKKNAVEETLNLQTLLEIAKDTSLSYKDRLIAVKELQKTYPAYFENLSREQILAGDTAIAEKDLTDAILSRAKAQAATSKITENQLKIIDLEEKRLDVVKRLSAAQAQAESAEKIRNAGGTGGGTIAGTYDVAFVAINKVASASNDLAKIDKEINEINIINNRLSGYALENNKKSIKLKQEETKAETKLKESKREKIEALNLEGIAIGNAIQEIDKYIDAIQTEINLSGDNAESLVVLKTALEQVKQAKTDLMTGGGEIISTANLKEFSTAVEEVKMQLSDLQKNYLKSFVDEFASNSGFSETFKMLSGEVEGFGENFAVTFNAIAESAQEAFNFISGISQQNFDAERERLQSQYEVSLAYAGDNKAAQEKLAEDLEKRKKEIANREAKAKQKQAIFNIAIDTAQAVVAALPDIPLSIVIGVLGALQIGLVASQKIPQYWMGGTHEGGLMMVNDGKGSNFQETIVTPDGKIMQPKGRNVIMNAPAGTEIFTQDQWNNTLQEMLQGKGILMSNNVVNSGGGATANQIDSIMGKHFSKISLNNIAFDENGMRVWSERNGNKTISTANRVSRRGKIV